MATLDTVATRASGTDFPAGKAYFETSTNKFIVWNGESWIELHSDGTGSAFLNQWGAHFNTTWGSATSITSQDMLYTGYTPAAGNNLSISWWFKGTTTNVNRSISPVMGNKNVGPYAPYLISAQTASRSLHVRWNYNQTTSSAGSGWGFGGTDGVDSVVDGNWHHLVLVISEVVGENKTKATLYVDASEFASYTGSANQMYTGPYTGDGGGGAFSEYIIGGLSNTTTYPFGDYIDDVAFFEAALTTEQVTFLRNEGKPGDVSSLDPKCWLRFGDHESDSPTAGGSIASVTDSSTYGNVVTTSASTQPQFLDLTGETIYA